MPILAAGSQAYLGYILESTYGVCPSSGTAYKMRLNTHSLELTQGLLESAEIRADRMTTDVQLGRYGVQGNIVVPPTYGDITTFLQALLGGTFTTASIGTPITCVSGSTVRSFSVEAGFTDIGIYQLFVGCLVNSLAVSIKPTSMVTWTWGIVGQSMTAGNTSINGVTPFTAPGGAAVASSFNGVITEAGASIAYMTALDFTIDNGITLPTVIGSRYAPGFFWGRQTIKGTLTAVFENTTLLNKFIASTETSLTATISGTPTATNTIELSFPRVKYTKATTPVQNPQGIVLGLSFEALLSAAGGTPWNVQATLSNANSNVAL